MAVEEALGEGSSRKAGNCTVHCGIGWEEGKLVVVVVEARVGEKTRSHVVTSKKKKLSDKLCTSARWEAAG